MLSDPILLIVAMASGLGILAAIAIAAIAIK
jgi:hypothetical protein